MARWQRSSPVAAGAVGGTHARQEAVPEAPARSASPVPALLRLAKSGPAGRREVLESGNAAVLLRQAEAGDEAAARALLHLSLDGDDTRVGLVASARTSAGQGTRSGRGPTSSAAEVAAPPGRTRAARGGEGGAAGSTTRTRAAGGRAGGTGTSVGKEMPNGPLRYRGGSAAGRRDPTAEG